MYVCHRFISEGEVEFRESESLCSLNLDGSFPLSISVSLPCFLVDSRPVDKEFAFAYREVLDMVRNQCTLRWLRYTILINPCRQLPTSMMQYQFSRRTVDVNMAVLQADPWLVDTYATRFMPSEADDTSLFVGVFLDAYLQHIICHTCASHLYDSIGAS